MRGRLIVQSAVSVPWPPCVCAWPEGKPIPDGWEEYEVVPPPLTHPCDCGHTQGHHISHRHRCLERGCDCLRFRAPE